MYFKCFLAAFLTRASQKLLIIIKIFFQQTISNLINFLPPQKKTIKEENDLLWIWIWQVVHHHEGKTPMMIPQLFSLSLLRKSHFFLDLDLFPSYFNYLNEHLIPMI